MATSPKNNFYDFDNEYTIAEERSEIADGMFTNETEEFMSSAMNDTKDNLNHLMN